MIRLVVVRGRRPVALRRRSRPVLVAVLAGLVAVGAVVAHANGTEQPSAPAPAAAARTLPRSYLPEAAGVPEAEEVAGVSVGPIPATELAVRTQFGFYQPARIVEYSGGRAEPGKPVSFTVQYLVDADDSDVGMLSWQFRGVASGSCPGPFLVRPVHSYLLHCRAVLRSGTTGEVVIAYRSEGTWETGQDLVLNCPGCADVFDPAAKRRADVRFARATAGVPEPSGVAGVAVGPAATGYTGLTGPVGVFDGTAVLPGRSYPFTVDYAVAPDADPVAALSVGLDGVLAGSCPKPFLIRPGHTYRISCRVTLRSRTAGELRLSSLFPGGEQTQAVPLVRRGS